MTPAHRPVLIALLCASVVAPPAALAADEPATVMAVEADDAQRIAFIEETLEAGRADAELWWQAWVVTYAGLMTVQALAIGAAPALFDDEDRVHGFRMSSMLGVATSFLGLTSLALLPSKAMHGADGFRDLPSDTPEQREVKRLAAEAALEAAARQQTFGGGRGWFVHVAGFAVNAASGLATWLWLDQPEMGAVKFGVGMAVVEAQAWTRPTGAIDGLESYRARFGGTVSSSAPLEWQFAPYPGGVGLHLSFR